MSNPEIDRSVENYEKILFTTNCMQLPACSKSFPLLLTIFPPFSHFCTHIPFRKSFSKNIYTKLYRTWPKQLVCMISIPILVEHVCWCFFLQLFYRHLFSIINLSRFYSLLLVDPSRTRCWMDEQDPVWLNKRMETPKV